MLKDYFSEFPIFEVVKPFFGVSSKFGTIIYLQFTTLKISVFAENTINVNLQRRKNF